MTRPRILVFGVMVSTLLLTACGDNEVLQDTREYLPFLAKGAVVTFRLTITTIPLMLAIAFFVGILRLSNNPYIRGVTATYIEIFRGTPLLIQLLYIFYVLPFFGFFINPFPAAVIGLSIGFAAYISETVRASFQSISKSQYEAARSLGMGYILTMRKIIFPQAIRILLPPLGNDIIELFKATAIVSLISVHDLTYQGSILTVRTFETALIWGLVAMFYFCMSYPSTFVVKWMERKVAYPA